MDGDGRGWRADQWNMEQQSKQPAAKLNALQIFQELRPGHRPLPNNAHPQNPEFQYPHPAPNWQSGSRRMQDLNRVNDANSNNRSFENIPPAAMANELADGNMSNSVFPRYVETVFRTQGPDAAINLVQNVNSELYQMRSPYKLTFLPAPHDSMNINFIDTRNQQSHGVIYLRRFSR